MRIALIHIQTISAAPIVAAFADQWPGADIFNILDEALFTAPVKGDAYVQERFIALARYAADTPVDAILFTCSAFGTAIEAAGSAVSPIPVLKPNEAMIEAAVAAGGRIGLLATFGPTLGTMPREFPPGTLSAKALAEGAFAALNARDHALHQQLIVETALRDLAGCDVIALAQSSMAPAAPAVAAATGKLVLTAPATAVAKLRRLLEPGPASAA